jgi:RNA polymerase sigma-70 factor (ECF subfamily)
MLFVLTNVNRSGEEFASRLQRAHEQSDVECADLLGAYRSYLRFIARDGIGPDLRSKVDESDVVQDVLMAAQANFKSFRGSAECELLSWLRRILANRIVHYARKHGARRVVQERSMEAILDESSVGLERLVEASGISPSSQAQAQEMASVLADALTTLPADYQEVVLLRNKEEQSWQEIAARMGRSSGAVRMLWLRALAALRPLLEGKL